MTYNPILQPAAERDLRGHADYIAAHNLAASLRFSEAVQEDIARLKDLPEAGGMRGFRSPALRDVRVWPMTRFPNCVIFYRIVENEVRILRILHGARDAAKLLNESTS